jgi:methyl-accepting chemotaxis protein
MSVRAWVNTLKNRFSAQITQGDEAMTQFYANLKLRTKLIAGFALVALLTAVTGIVGLVSIKSFDAINSEVSDVYIVAQERLTDVMGAVKDVRIGLRDIALTDDAQKRQAYKDGLESTASTLATALDAFSKLLPADSPETQDELKRFSDAVADYRSMRTDLVNLLMADDTRESGIEQMYGTDSANITQTLVNETNLMTQRVRDLTNAATLRQSQIESTANVSMLAAVIFSIIAGLLLGMTIANSIAKGIRNISDTVSLVAEGDFTVSSEIHNKSELGLLSTQINEMVAKLRDVLKKVSDVSDIVDDASKQVASSSMSLAQISTEQASSVEEISASMLEITSQTKANAENANMATKLSESTRVNAVSGNDRMGGMLAAMQAINEASSSISNIIKVIDDIAFQTNILALNAADEAARAGQHGKGFAVVAEEVRTLASRSATAASETTQMIERSIKEVERGTQIANETAAALKEIVDGVASTASLVSSISAASDQQSQDASQISGGMDQVSQAIQTTSSVAQEAASSSSELADQATTLKELVSAFRFEETPALGSRAAQQRRLAPAKDPGQSAPQAPAARARGNVPPISLASGDFGKY